MGNEHEIDRAHQIDQGTGRVGYAQPAGAERRDDAFDRQLSRPRDAGVVGTEGVQPMCVRSCNERFAETVGNFDGAPVRIEETTPEMTKLDRVETIDSFQEPFAD